MGTNKYFKIVALGDSITQGFPYGENNSWVYIISKKYGVPIINRGMCGDFTSGMLSRFHRDVILDKPDAVILLGAYNDAFSNIPLETVSSNFKQMCSLALKHNIKPVLGLPTPVDIPHVEAMLTSYRNWIIDYTTKENIKSVNFYKMFFNPATGDSLAGTTTDGAHPSIEGYKIMAKAVELDKLFPELILN